MYSENQRPDSQDYGVEEFIESVKREFSATELEGVLERYTTDHPSIGDRTFCACCFLHHEPEDGCIDHSIEASDAFLGLPRWEEQS